MSVSTLPTNSDVMAKLTTAINTTGSYGNEYSLNRTSTLQYYFASSGTNFVYSLPITVNNTTSKTSGFIRVSWSYDTPIMLAYPSNITYSVSVNGTALNIPNSGAPTGVCIVPNAGIGKSVMVSVPCTLLPNAVNNIVVSHAFPGAIVGYSVTISSFNFEASAITY